MRRRKLCCGKKGTELGREAPTSAAVLPDLITSLIFTRFSFEKNKLLTDLENKHLRLISAKETLSKINSCLSCLHDIMQNIAN